MAELATGPENKIEVDPATAIDHIVDARLVRQVDELLDAAAEARAAAAAK